MWLLNPLKVDNRNGLALSDVNLNRLVVFAAVVEAGSLTAAADRLGIAKTMVSTHMQRLEAEVGASLLIRTTRRVSVTEAGRTFYEASRQILSATRGISALAQAPACARNPARRHAYRLWDERGGAHARRRCSNAIRSSRSNSCRLIVRGSGCRSFDVAIRLGRLADSSHRAVKIGGFVKWLVASPCIPPPAKSTSRSANFPFVGMCQVHEATGGMA